MSDYTIHTAATAPQGSREVLEGVEKQLGFVPNLMGVMAEAPSTLKAYLNLTQLLGETSFSPIEEQVVALAVSHVNECTYCMAAHSAIAKSVGMSDDDLTTLRDGGPLEDTTLEALRAFTVDVVETRGWASPATQSAFFEAGYTRTHVLEVLVGVAMKTLSNYVNHTADTPLDPQFALFAWSPTDASVDAA